MPSCFGEQLEGVVAKVSQRDKGEFMEKNWGRGGGGSLSSRGLYIWFWCFFSSGRIFGGGGEDGALSKIYNLKGKFHF